MTLAPPTLADLTEKEWAAQVYELLATLGWSRYHTWRSKHSPAGYPDETCWRERVLWLELKREGGKLSPEQKRVIGGLLKAGAEVYVVRPRDLDALAKVLAHRGPPQRRTHGRHCPCSACAREDWTRPELAPCGMHGPGCPPRYEVLPDDLREQTRKECA